MTVVDEPFAKQGRYPLDNLTYDLVCLIHEKSKGLQALDQYLDDARSDPRLSALLHRIRQHEGQFIDELKRELGHRIMTAASSGKLVNPRSS